MEESTATKDHSLKPWEVVRNINHQIENACRCGELVRVVKLISSGDFQELVLPHDDLAYLPHACVHGHMDVVKVLCHFTQNEVRDKIVSSKNIKQAMYTAARYGQNDVFLYLSQSFPQHHASFLKEMNLTSLIDLLCMSGKLSTIELLMNDIKDKDNLDYGLFISKSVQYDKRNCFEYLLHNLPEQCKTAVNEAKNLEDLLHTCLYCERFDYLKTLMVHTSIDPCRHLSIQSFAILVEVKPESLKHIVLNYGYAPNEQLMDKINDCLQRNDNPHMCQALENFLSIVQKNQLFNKIESLVEEKPLILPKRKL